MEPMRKRLFIKAIGIMVTEAMYERIMHLCDVKELAISEFVRDALEVKLAQLAHEKDNDNILTDG